MHTRIIVGRLEFLTKKKDFKIYLNSLIQREKNLKKVFCWKKLFTIEGGVGRQIYTPEESYQILKENHLNSFVFLSGRGSILLE